MLLTVTSMVTGTPEQWQRVADAVNARIVELGTDQAKVAREAQLSDPVIRHLQSADQLRYRAGNLSKVSTALRWRHDGIQRILNGESPEDETRQLEAEIADLRDLLRDYEQEIEREGDEVGEQVIVLRDHYANELDRAIERLKRARGEPSRLDKFYGPKPKRPPVERQPAALSGKFDRLTPRQRAYIEGLVDELLGDDETTPT